MRYTLTILGWHPYRCNQWRGRHWGVAARLREREAEILWSSALLAGVPVAMGPRRVGLILHGWPSGRFPDRDAFDKLLLDALVQARVLVDDGPAHLIGRVDVRYVRSRQKKTIIWLEEAPALFP